MANITTAEVTLATIIAANALGSLKANTVLANLVIRDWDNEVATHGQTITVPIRGALSVNDKAANTDITLQTPNDSTASVTLNKHKEVSFVIEDIAKALSRPDYLMGYVDDAVVALAEQIDTDLAGLYSGLSQTIDATSGLGEDDFREGRRLLNSAKAPLSNRHAVVHEDAEYELLAIEKFIRSDYPGLQGQSGALVDSFSGRFMGFNVHMDQKIAVASSQCKNLFFHRDAMVLATRQLPNAPAELGVMQRTMSEDGVGLRVTLSYDHDKLGTKATIDCLYGVAEVRDNHGVAVSTSEI